MNRIFVLIALLISFAVGCGAQSTPQRGDSNVMAPQQKVEALFDKINIGDSRAQVQKLLGAPFMVQKAADGETSMYMSGMEGMNDAIHAQMQAAQFSGAASGFLGTATSLLGLAGPGGAIAGGMADQVLSAGIGIAGSSAAMAMPDPSKMEMLMVRYQNDKVAELRRMNMGAMGNPFPSDSLE